MAGVAMSKTTNRIQTNAVGAPVHGGGHKSGEADDHQDRGEAPEPPCPVTLGVVRRIGL
jgi:hypothetical protein